MHTVQTIAELEELANTLIHVILHSTNKRRLTRAFREIRCLITGCCLCDLCPEWEHKDVAVLYEFSRCIVPTKILQRIKHRHHQTRRWVYIAPLYRCLYESLFDDILPCTLDYSCSAQTPIANWSAISVEHSTTSTVPWKSSKRGVSRTRSMINESLTPSSS